MCEAGNEEKRKSEQNRRTNKKQNAKKHIEANEKRFIHSSTHTQTYTIQL